jgi:hypothetical protein
MVHASSNLLIWSIAGANIRLNDGLVLGQNRVNLHTPHISTMHQIFDNT